MVDMSELKILHLLNHAEKEHFAADGEKGGKRRKLRRSGRRGLVADGEKGGKDERAGNERRKRANKRPTRESV